MARSIRLHTEAGYISARPTSPSPKASCDARPVHTFGSEADGMKAQSFVRFVPLPDVPRVFLPQNSPYQSV